MGFNGKCLNIFVSSYTYEFCLKCRFLHITEFMLQYYLHTRDSEKEFKENTKRLSTFRRNFYIYYIFCLFCFCLFGSLCFCFSLINASLCLFVCWLMDSLSLFFVFFSLSLSLMHGCLHINLHDL